MKKFIALILVVILLSTTLSGCGLIGRIVPGFSLGSIFSMFTDKIPEKRPAAAMPEPSLPAVDATVAPTEATVDVPVPPETFPATEAPTEAPTEPLPVFRTIGATTSGTNLNVRSGPGTDYEIVTNMEEKGIRVTIYEVTYVGDDLWGNIGLGWISLNFAVLDDPAVIPYSDPNRYTGITLNDPTRIHIGPGTQYASYRGYSVNSDIDIIGLSGRWAKTADGWVSLDEVYLN